MCRELDVNLDVHSRSYSFLVYCRYLGFYVGSLFDVFFAVSTGASECLEERLVSAMTSCDVSVSGR